MSDGWGDASGIEGNYEENDTDEDDSGELSEVNETGESNSSTETPESTATNETNTTRKTSGTSKSSETNVTSKTKTNIKDEWNGRTIYIPDDILDEMEDTYLESQLKLRKADQDEFQKNRHFYPLLVQFGIEALADADAAEIQTRLSGLDDE